MAKCWTCGSPFVGGVGHTFDCPLCRAEGQLKQIREKLGSSGATSINVAVEMTGLDQLSGELSGISSTLIWGFEETFWRLDQMTGLLKSIDETLKTPSQTQANEWRQIAEELRKRGVLDESERFYLKSLETNPLDYRAYIGMGKIYLRIEGPKKAREYWGKSLPHAPKKEFDYQSYSWRLIGRSYFCEEDFQKASQSLRTAIQLSPNYYMGHYDYAQYSALEGNQENCLNSLLIAIIRGSIPLELAEKESVFSSLGGETSRALKLLKCGEDEIRAEEAVLDEETSEAKATTELTRLDGTMWDISRLSDLREEISQSLSGTTNLILEEVTAYSKERSLSVGEVRGKWPYIYLLSLVKKAGHCEEEGDSHHESAHALREADSMINQKMALHYDAIRDYQMTSILCSIINRVRKETEQKRSPNRS